MEETFLLAHAKAYFNLQVRWGANAGKVNQLVHSTDPFSIDVTTAIRRGTDAEVVGYLRTVADNCGVDGATGALSLWLHGTLVTGYPLAMDPDAARGVGYFAVRVPGSDLLPRGQYRWQVTAEDPDGGTALAEGTFHL